MPTFEGGGGGKEGGRGRRGREERGRRVTMIRIYLTTIDYVQSAFKHSIS